LTEIYLCHTCSCHGILRMETPGQDALVFNEPVDRELYPEYYGE
jgi:hypothetical protein